MLHMPFCTYWREITAMLRIAVVIPNRNKCAPNDIAISQVLKLREMGFLVDLISLRNRGSDYEIDGLNILNFRSQRGAIAFFKADTYFFPYVFARSYGAFC